VLPKERIIAALEHRESDRVPTGENEVDYVLVEKALGIRTLYNSRWREMQALWDGRRDEIVADCKRAYVAIGRHFRWDYIRVGLAPPKKEYRRPEMVGPYSWIDDDGNTVRYAPDAGNIAHTEPSTNLTIDDLPTEPFEVDPTQLEVVEHVVRELGETHFIIGRIYPDGTFPWQETVGMEELLVRMITDPDFVHRAVDVYTDQCVAYIKAILKTGCDAVMTLDDYCDNKGPIMGLERFREFILPGLKKQVRAAHDAGGYFIKHTDGNTWSILGALTEAEVDAWHGIQPTAGMDLRLLKERHGQDLCLFGGVNCETLVAGTPTAVRDEVKYAIKHAAQGGGLVLTSGNVLQPGAQYENYVAMRQAIEDYGGYPIDL